MKSVDKETGHMLERALMYFDQKVISQLPKGKERTEFERVWKKAWDSIEYAE